MNICKECAHYTPWQYGVGKCNRPSIRVDFAGYLSKERDCVLVGSNYGSNIQAHVGEDFGCIFWLNKIANIPPKEEK